MLRGTLKTPSCPITIITGCGMVMLAVSRTSSMLSLQMSVSTKNELLHISNKLINWFRLSRPAFCGTLLSGLDGLGLWRILFCLTFRRHLCAASPGVVSLAVRWTVFLEESPRKNTVPPDRLLIWLPERSFLKIPHRDGGERSIRRESTNNHGHQVRATEFYKYMIYMIYDIWYVYICSTCDTVIF